MILLIYKLNLDFVEYKIFQKESHCALSTWFLFKYHLSSEIIWINLFACLL